MLVLTFLTARMAARISTKYLVGIGTIFSVAGPILLPHSLSVGMTMTDLIPRFALFGVPLGHTLSQLDNLTISFAKPSETDEPSGGYDTSSWLGSSLGTAVIGALFVRLVEAKPPPPAHTLRLLASGKPFLMIHCLGVDIVTLHANNWRY